MSSQALIKELAGIVGQAGLMEQESDLLSYSYDAAVVDQVRPLAVVRPGELEQMGRVVALCNREGIPLTVRGSGTNLSGGVVPLSGGVVMVTTGLRRIKEINEADMYAVVEPGVVTARFFDAAMKKNLFYPPDPGSQAVSTLGGNVAENAGGLRGLKYGVTRDYVLGVSFFDVEGGLVKTGSRTVKCAAGYNLGGLMVGSEGTLGVFGEITLKLIPPPQTAKAMLATFDSEQAASQAVAAIIAAHIVPATLEFLDNFTIRTVEDYSHVGLPLDAAALLLIEVDGHPAMVDEQAEEVQKICRREGATEVRAARDAAERNKVWEARRAAIPALARLRPTLVLEDATVPRSRIPDMTAALRDIAGKYRITIGTFGHAGDGNLHPCLLCDKRDPDEWRRVEEAVAEIFARALELGGTISGEHGLGLRKKQFLAEEAGAATIRWSKRLKAALDPKGILNPDKAIGDD